ncbi:MAG: hypothetical protein A2W17_06180 [Planctomycetes bacterium RBG_16_41_13]|nr:MAG: hypothetical protein A2W17_06180 [Planctomycetes bacterium RBG_16_41_13]
MKLRKIFLVIGVIVVLLLVSYLTFKERNTYSCDECFSKRSVCEWKFGMWMASSIPLSPAWEEVMESHVYNSFFSKDHKHQWTFMQGSPYNFFGTTWGGCALGSGGQWNELVYYYEQDPRFREFITKKVNTKELERSQLLKLITIPPYVGKDESDSKEVVEDVKLINSLIYEYDHP